jgi:hypothetical protein
LRLLVLLSAVRKSIFIRVSLKKLCFGDQILV